MYQPNYTITSSLNSQIAEIERIRTAVEKSPILPEQEVVLRYRAAVEAVYSSTSIENNPLERDEVEAVMKGQPLNLAKQAVLEVDNYIRAWEWLKDRAKKNQALSESDVLQAHQILTKGLLPESKVGAYRPSSIYIIDGSGEARYEGPTASKINYLVQELLDWFEAEPELHPVLKAAIFHYEFVSIHPFADGNGRVTRLLTLLTLWLSGYDFRQVLVPDSYYWRQRSAYYQALNQAPTYRAQRVADLTPWFEFFVAGFLAEAEKLEEKISLVEISGDVETPLKLSDDQIELLDFSKKMGQIDVEDVVDILGVSKRTAQRRLKKLVEQNLLLRKEAGPATYYVLEESSTIKI